MQVHRPLLAIASLAALVCAAAGAQSGEVKIPRPLPTERPVKGPAPAVPPSEAVQSAPFRPEPRRALDPQVKPELPDGLAHLRPMHDPDLLQFATVEDGTIWARAAGYKARFGVDGAEYIPYFGPRAPRNYPIAFRLREIGAAGGAVSFAGPVLPSRQADTVVFDRGAVIESYQLSPQGMEQTFVFAELPVASDLVVRMDVETELVAAADADGFRFANDLGSVSYGRAEVLDAAGRRTPVTSRLEQGSLEIRVPAEFLAAAAFPVTVDPFISSIGIDTSSYDDFNPDIAYDASTDRYLVVYEEAFSATDDDVYSAFVTSGGWTISNHYIDFTTVFWAFPKVANNNLAHNFLVVAGAYNLQGSGDTWRVRGATVDALSGTVGPQFTISTGTQGSDNKYPDVGGDPVLVGPTYYLVCWQNTYSPTDFDIYARLVDAAGNLQGSGPIYVDFSTADDQYPRISKSDGHAPFSTQRWTITWGRRDPSDNWRRPWAAQYLWDGSLVHSSFLIDGGVHLGGSAQPSSLLDGASGERDYLVAYVSHDPSSTDIQARIYNGTTWLAGADISVLEDQGFAGQAQGQVSVDSDGSSYVLAYTEQYGTGTYDHDTYVASVARTGNAIQVAERHVNFDFSIYSSNYPQIASAYSGGGPQHRFLLAWQTDSSSTNRDILGGFYDAGTFASFCSPSGSFFDQTIPCPCGNPPAGSGRGCDNSSATGGAQLSATGTASLSGDTLVLTASGEKPNGLSTFWQGTSPYFGGTVFGQGVRCVTGVLKRLYTHSASGGVVSAPVGTDPDIHTRSAALGDPIGAGSARYYFTSYRDVTVLGGCASTSTFNSTQSGSLVWYP